MYEPHIVERANNFQQTFDARIALMVNDSMVIDIYKNLYWRSVLDCHRNFVSGIAHARLVHKACHGKNTSEMIQLMKENFGYDYEENDFLFAMEHLVSENYTKKKVSIRKLAKKLCVFVPKSLIEPLILKVPVLL